MKNGRVDQTIQVNSRGSSESKARIRFDESGWLLLRAVADVPHTFRFASTGPFYVEVGTKPRRISKASAQLFLDWVEERIKQVNLDDQEQRADVLKYHQDAERFWKAKVAEATAD